MLALSNVSSSKLIEVRNKFMAQEDWNIDMIPILLFANQRNSSMKTICDNLKNGHMVDMKNLKGNELIQKVLPLLFVPLDFQIGHGKYQEYSLENLLLYAKDTTMVDYLLSFVTESKQTFPVYDHVEHVEACNVFFNDLQRIIISGLFPISFNSGEFIAQTNLLLLFNICMELASRKIESMDELFWDPILDRYSVINHSKVYGEMELPILKSNAFGWSLAVLEDVDTEIYKDFLTIKGCSCKYIKCPELSLQKRDAPDKTKIENRIVISMYDILAVNASLENNENILSEVCKETISKMLKHLKVSSRARIENN